MSVTKCDDYTPTTTPRARSMATPTPNAIAGSIVGGKCVSQDSDILFRTPEDQTNAYKNTG